VLNVVVNITRRLSILKLSGILLLPCSDGDGVTEFVGCLRKFHGGEEIRSLPSGNVFHKICVDKWILDYDNITCPLCRVCLYFPV